MSPRGSDFFRTTVRRWESKVRFSYGYRPATLPYQTHIPRCTATLRRYVRGRKHTLAASTVAEIAVVLHQTSFTSQRSCPSFQRSSGSSCQPSYLIVTPGRWRTYEFHRPWMPCASQRSRHLDGGESSRARDPEVCPS